MGTATRGPADPERRFVRRLMQGPLLSAEEELDLAARWRRDHDHAALHRLTTAYMRLVVGAANRFRHYGLPVADLLQEGAIGLMEAAARFEPERAVRFSTYASWWVRAAMQDHVLRNWSIVRTGTTAAHKTLFFNLRRLRARIGADGDGPLSHAARSAIADRLGVPVRDVEQMEGRLSGADRSLNAPVGEDADIAWQDLLVDDRPSPEEALMRDHDGRLRARWLKLALEELNPRERLVVDERCLTENGPTLESLGVRLGVSKERVRQIEAQALGKLTRAVRRVAGDAGYAAPTP